MMKTVVVEITRTYQHPLYKKVVHAAKRFKAHDELGAKVGDRSCAGRSRPLSRDKHWVVESIIRRQGEVDQIDASETWKQVKENNHDPTRIPHQSSG
jgi:small subunit ribosomal protein S17